jgi:PIN domain nuclease of toxin-antitoxin system
VLDASAVLAMILSEPGGKRVNLLLDDLESGSAAHIAISSVNWCEILTRMHREKLGMTTERLAAILAGVELMSFGKAEAEAAASYAEVSRALSLGDRACIALARSLNATAWTADRSWKHYKLDVPVELIRP